MRFAMSLAYDGRNYYGYVRQPGLKTVESVLFEAIGKSMDFEPVAARYKVATRTDRGVSAIGQVVAIDLPREVGPAEINSHLPEDVAVLSVHEVKDIFDPRFHAVGKHYRYICEVTEKFDVGAARKTAMLLEGHHNFAAFCRREQGRSTLSEVKRVMVRKVGSFLIMDFFARSFLWQQVRRMSSTIIGAGYGRMGESEVSELLKNPGTKGIPPADPEGLFLVEVRYERARFSPDEMAKQRFMEYLKKSEHPVCGAMVETLKNRF